MYIDTFTVPVSSARKSGTVVLINYSLRGDGYTP